MLNLEETSFMDDPLQKISVLGLDNGPDCIFLFTTLIFQPISLILTKALESLLIHPL